MALTDAGQQPHQRIKECAHGGGVLAELVAHRDRPVDADRVLGRVDRSLGWEELVIVAGTAIKLSTSPFQIPFFEFLRSGSELA